jgi:hypothetical protein
MPCQGMTSVMPIMPEVNPALAAEGMFSEFPEERRIPELHSKLMPSEIYQPEISHHPRNSR